MAFLFLFAVTGVSAADQAAWPPPHAWATASGPGPSYGPVSDADADDAASTNNGGCMMLVGGGVLPAAASSRVSAASSRRRSRLGKLILVPSAAFTASDASRLMVTAANARLKASMALMVVSGWGVGGGPSIGEEEIRCGWVGIEVVDGCGGEDGGRVLRGGDVVP